MVTICHPDDIYSRHQRLNLQILDTLNSTDGFTDQYISQHIGQNKLSCT